MTVEIRELVPLLLLLAGLLPVTRAFLEQRKKRWMFAGYLALTASAVATVAEGFVLPAVLNYLEHVGIAAAGLLFAVTAYHSHRQTRDIQQRVEAGVEA